MGKRLYRSQFAPLVQQVAATAPVTATRSGASPESVPVADGGASALAGLSLEEKAMRAREFLKKPRAERGRRPRLLFGAHRHEGPRRLAVRAGAGARAPARRVPPSARLALGVFVFDRRAPRVARYMPVALHRTDTAHRPSGATGGLP